MVYISKPFQIILKTKESKERDTALGIKKKIENLDFVFLLVLQDEILRIINLPAKQLQSKKMDLFMAHDQLENICIVEHEKVKKWVRFYT